MTRDCETKKKYGLQKSGEKCVVIIITVARVISGGVTREGRKVKDQRDLALVESESAAEVDAGIRWEKFTETNLTQ